MDILNIAKSVGIGIFKEVVPAGSAILESVNAMLPDDMKFIGGETGVEIAERIKSLPPELQQEIKLKEFDVKIEQLRQSHDTLRVMLAQDAVTPQTTRPRIALGAFRVVSLLSVIYMLMFSWAVISGEPDMVDSIVSGWPLVVAVVAPFVMWLNAYFGIIKQETESKLNAMNGQQINTDGILNKAVNIFKSK